MPQFLHSSKTRHHHYNTHHHRIHSCHFVWTICCTCYTLKFCQLFHHPHSLHSCRFHQNLPMLWFQMMENVLKGLMVTLLIVSMEIVLIILTFTEMEIGFINKYLQKIEALNCRNSTLKIYAVGIGTTSFMLYTRHWP